MFVAGAVVGMFLGAAIGVLALSLAAISGQADDRAEDAIARFRQGLDGLPLGSPLLAYDDPRVSS